jgi:ATP-binding cassette, subfamily B, bacterial PglK
MISVYKQIFDILDRRERRRFFILLLMILVMGMLDVAGVASILPFLAVLSNPAVIHDNAHLSAVFNLLGFESERSFLLFLASAVFVLVVTGLFFKTLTLYALTLFSTMRTYSISSRLLGNYLSKPYVWFLGRHSADLEKTILSEVDHVIGTSIVPAMHLLAHGTVLVALVLLLLVVDPFVVLIAVALLGGIYMLTYLVIRNLLDRVGQMRVLGNGERYQVATEVFGGIKDVKFLGLETVYLDRFRKPVYIYSRSLATGHILASLPRYVLEAVALGGLLVLVLVLLARSDGSLGAMLPVIGVFAFAGSRLIPTMQQVYQSFASMRQGRYALEVLHKEIMESGAPELRSRAAEALTLTDSLQLTGVRFQYPTANTPALDGLSLDIAANTTVGLVGGSGAGKTTAVDVILGLLQPQEGALRVDGADIGAHNRTAWQRSVGYVPQQIFLMDDTVTANIAFGIPPGEVDRAAVERASRIAELHDFVVQDLPNGYDTMVGERGVRLSGGQRQRIGIARALYHDPQLLVMDEATSALDNLTERAVMDAVHNLAGAKTIIMVAHRLSTVADCSELFLLEHGRLAARGTYNELLRTSDRFRRMAGGRSDA